MSGGNALLRTLRMPDGAIADIRVTDGIISEIGPSLRRREDEGEPIDGGGDLVLPGFVDGHMHLDKTLTGTPWMPHRAGPDRSSRIETEKTLRASLPPPAERAANLVRLCIANGTTAIRTHVDVDPTIGIEHIEALLEVRREFADAVDMQLIAFPQSGVFRQPGVGDLLAAALDAGADILGGIDPIAVDDDLDGQLDFLFALAERKGVGIDIHLHDAGENGQKEIDGVTKRARAHGMAKKVTVSHGFCLGAAADSIVDGLADAMAEAGVSLVTHGGGASPLPPVKRLRARGVEVFAGNDDVRDPWSPFGEGDMLERAMLIAWRSGYRTDPDLEIALDCTTLAGKRVLGLDAGGIVIGAPADFCTVTAETPAEAVARHPKRRLVFKRGRLVAEGGAFAG